MQNLFLGAKLSEYHTGFRAFAREVLLDLPLSESSDGFVFDNEMLAQCIFFQFRIGEISCLTKYFQEVSSIDFRGSRDTGLGSSLRRPNPPCRSWVSLIFVSSTHPEKLPGTYYAAPAGPWAGQLPNPGILK